MLKRQKQELPQYIEEALVSSSVMSDYLKRPSYQQNDYISWVSRAKQETTKQKRLQQMINELKLGGVYMNMDHPASQKDKIT